MWMRIQRGGIITWTWLASRTTPPDLKVSEGRLWVCPKQQCLLERYLWFGTFHRDLDASHVKPVAPSCGYKRYEDLT